MSATRATKQSQQSQQRKRKSSATSTLSDAAPVAVRAKKAASAAAAAAAAVPAAPVILSAVAARKLALAEAAAVAAAAAAAAATDPVVEEASVDKRKGKAPRAAEDSPDNSSDEGDAVSENGIDLDGLGTNAATVLSTDMPRLQHGSHASAVKIVSGGSKPRYFQAAPDSDSDSDSDADSDAQEVTLASDLPAQGSRAARLTLDSTDKSAAEETEAESIASASSRKGRGSPRKDGSRTGRKRRRGNNGDDSGAFLDPSCISTWAPTAQQSWFEVERRSASSTSANHGASLLIALYPGETVLARGIYTLSVLRGQIMLSQAVLTPDSAPLDVFAPASHPLPVIRAQPATAGTQHGQQNALAALSTISGPVDLESALVGVPTLILLESRPRTGVEGIERVMRCAGMPVPFGGLWASRNGREPQPIAGGSFDLITQPERDLMAAILPENWRQALGTLARPARETSDGLGASDSEHAPICVVQGSKSVGKSTFAKLAVNALLTSPQRRRDRVAFLDTDLGQSELGPSGLVSLHILDTPLVGPSFTHQNRLPLRAHFLGTASPKNDPSAYLSATHDLLSAYFALAASSGAYDDASAIPLVINTQGWTKGLGADLLQEIHRMLEGFLQDNGVDPVAVRVYDFAQATPGGYEAFVPRGQGSASSTTMTAVPGSHIMSLQPIYLPEAGPAKLTPSDLRMLSLISYLHLSPSSFLPPPAPAQSTGPQRMPSWDFVTSLVRRRPYAVPWSVIQRVDMLGSEEVACEEVLRALDVSIVALVESAAETDRAVPLVPQAAPATSAGQLRYDPNAPPTSAQGTLCLGLGVVRAIDTANASFHLLTPLPATLFGRVNVLQKGEIELPTVLMVDYAAEHDGPEGAICGVEYAQVPYLESTGYGNGVGSKKRRVRRNVMRRSQFR